MSMKLFGNLIEIDETILADNVPFDMGISVTKTIKTDI